MSAQKYRLTDETTIVDGVTVYRIEYLRNVRHYLMDVVAAKGSRGGFLQSEANLNQNDSSVVNDSAVVLGNARVTGWGTQVCGRAIVSGDARVSKNAFVGDDAKIGGKVRIIDGMYYGKIEITGRTTLNNCDLKGDLLISGGCYDDNVVYDREPDIRECRQERKRLNRQQKPAEANS